MPIGNTSIDKNFVNPSYANDQFLLPFKVLHFYSKNYFFYICLILEAKLGDDPLSKHWQLGLTFFIRAGKQTIFDQSKLFFPQISKVWRFFSICCLAEIPLRLVLLSSKYLINSSRSFKNGIYIIGFLVLQEGFY